MRFISKTVAADSPKSWVEFLDNKQLVLGTFAGRVPQFENLRLNQLTLCELGYVRISFNLELPEGSPRRWIEKNYDSLQLRLTFYPFPNFSVTGKDFEPGMDMVAEFDESGMLWVFHERLQIRLSSERISLDLYPYDSNVFEEPRSWRYKMS